MLSYAERKQTLIDQLRASRGSELALGKATSNLFRDRTPAARQRLDVRAFHHVLEVDAKQGWVDVEGMTPYDVLAAATLRYGAMPCVVPQLKSITIGGAVAGIGIEATSFRYGLAHATMLELEVLLADGSVVVCTEDNQHRDLFFGFPNSYGTLGYALRVRTRTIPAKPYVAVTHIRHTDPRTYFEQIGELCKATDVDFLDGAVFAKDALYISVGRFADTAPYVSDYTFEQIYYRSIPNREHDFLTATDYLWRWDTDWFWCSKNLGAQNPWLRRLLGRSRLNSRFYTKVMRLNSRLRLTRMLDRASGYRHRETVIQDVDVPLAHAADFLDFFQREIGVTPIWICPIATRGQWTLYPMEPGKMYVNFGFWDVVRKDEPHAAGHFNRLVERKVLELGGIKSLYSDSYFTPQAFWSAYNGEGYRALKQRYDPKGRFKDLYAKCVERG